MKKNYLSTKVVLGVCMLLAVLLPATSKAQCGLAAFATPAGALTPTTAWQNVTVGSGTYATFNVTSGNIYSFRYTTVSNAGYNWDMTVSNTSTALPYNNSSTPLRDPWTGGVCPGASSPQSTDWYSTYTGTLRINTKAVNGVGTCFDYVSGMGSATLQYKVCTPVGDPGSGSNAWNVEAFATGDISIPNTSARWGYYSDNNLNFASTNFWGNTLNPGVASGWVGCSMPNDMFTVRARRTNFPCGYYQLFLNNADDDVRVYVNGTQIYAAGCCAANVNLGNYVLGSGDNVEVRFTGVCSGDNVSLAFNSLSLPAVSGGTIGGVANGANICEGQPVGLLTNVTSGSGGAAGLTNGGSVSYDWEFSTNGGATYTSAGISTSSWNVTSVVPVGGVYAFRRKTIDRCGNTAYSNVIIVNGRSTPNGSFAPANQTICPGTSANLTLNFSPGSAPFNVVYSDGVTNTTLTGISNGASITLSPTSTTNYSFVSITDGYGCSRSSGFIGGAQIAVQPSIAINSITTTNVNCNAGTDGTITISASGGVAPLQYSINNGGSYQTSNTFTGLAAGNYNVVVKDAFNCSKAYGSVTVISQPTALTHTTTKADASCSNVSDGTITVSASGGTTPYLYSINGGPTQSGNQFTNLAAGTYTIRVFDAHNCVSLSTVTINNSYAVTGNITAQTNVSCFGGADGSLTALLTGGIAPNQYSFNGGGFSTTNTFSGLSIGTYTIVMKDSHGCIDTKSATITQPTLLTTAVDSIKNANCFGTSTGGVYITPAGGTAPYTYNWSNGTTAQDAVNLAIGTYSVTVTDNKGCTATASGTVTQPTLLVPTITSYHDLNCFQDLSGSIDLSVSGSVAPYTYVWSNGATTQDVSGLAAGTYAVTVTDAHGCTAGISQTLAQPTDVVHTTDTVAASCSNVFDGKITINAGGGIAPYQYSLNGGPTQAGNQFTGLGAGTYTVYVYDAHGCADSSTAVINNSYAVTGSITNQTNVSCFGGADGSLTVQLSGGIPPYLYSLNGGSYTTTNTFTGLTAGVYVIGMRDSKGCNDFQSVTITQPAQLTIVIDSVVNATCNGATTGGVYINVVGGTPQGGLYNYNWSNGVTTQDNVNVGAGTYLVTVTDSKGCTTTGGATVTQPLVLAGAVANFHNLNCNSDATGSIDISINGGVPPYTYNWSNGATTEDVNGLAAGAYSVTVLDANNCSLVLSKTLSEPAALTSTISGTNLSCFNNATGSVDLTPAGGTTPYTFYWNTGATTEDIAAIPAGTYTVIVTDAHNCTATNAITISQPAQVVVTGVVSNIACNNATTGSIDLTATGGTGTISFAWSNGATTEDVSGLAAGTYSVTATDVNACSATASFTITQPAPLSLSVTSFGDVACNGGNNGFINVNTLGGVANYTYVWSNGATTEDVTGLIAGTYTLTVTDANSCTATVSQVIGEPAALQASASTGTITCNGGTTSVTLTVTGGTTNYTYFWNNGATTQNLSNVGAGTYTVLVTDAHNCTATASATITQPTAVTVSGVTTNVNCFGGTDGAIDVTAGGGTGALSFAWSNGATTEDLNSLAAGSYSVTVSDANGCSVSASYTITQPALLTATVVSTGDVNCNGGTNGFINVAVTGGVTNYTYNWSNGATIEDLVNIPAGTYTLTVTDAHGCTATTVATINEPALLTASISTGTITCYGGTTNVTLTVNGGTTNYSYFWNNGATTQNLSNVGAGTYTVAVTDAHGCTATATTTITQPAGVTLSGVTTNVNCFGGTDGAIDVTAGGGTGTLSFAWSNGATTEDLSSIAAGSYSVTVTDANGCSVSASYTITQPALLVATIVSSGNVSCYGNSNGFINVTVTGGVTNYTYNWSNGAAIEDLVNITAGTYTLTVTDAHGCTATASNTITQPDTLTASVAAGTITCNGGTTNVTLTVNGGTTNYSYFWNNGATTQNLSNVGPGTYTVVVTDAHNCTATASVVITQPAAIVVSGVATNVSCFNGNNGAVDLTATGGTGTLSFAWSNGATTEDLTGLTVGNYTVTVTDANGCSATAGFTITQPASSVTVTAVATDVTCNGAANGSVNATVAGGTFGYTYLWNNGATTEDISGLAPATYTITVTDGNGCTASASATVSEPAVLTASITGTDVTCFGGNNGAADLTVAGGNAPYTYFWSTFEFTQDISGLTAGNYSVIVTDSKSCSAVASVTISQPAAIVIAAVVNNASCNGSIDGSIDITVTGGTGAGTYSYQWNTSATTEDLTNLGAGTYNVTVIDNNGCTATASYVITQPAPIVITGTPTSISCNGGTTTIDITVTGGTAPYTYSWSNGATTQDLTNVPAGAYGVEVTDANFCTATAFYNVPQPAALVSSFVATNVSCFGASNGAIDETVTGGTPPYTYLWNTFNTTQDLNNISGGTYFVIITDANGCKKTDSIVITEPTALQLTVSATNILCNGGTGAVDLTVSGGTLAYSFAWSNGATTEDLSAVGPGTYTVTVTDGNGCTATASATVTEPAAINAVIASYNNVSCFGANNGNINISVTGGVTPYTFAWSNGNLTEDLVNVGPGTYTVTITDANACTATLTQVITEPAAMTATATATTILCNGGTADVDLTVTGGSTPYSYFWNSGALTEDLTGVPAGTYSVLVTDAHSCTANASITITQPTALSLSVAVTNVQCNGGNGTIDLSVSGATPAYTYNWSNGATTQDITTTAGSYTVTVSDANACSATIAATITQPTALSINAQTVNVACNNGTNGSINITVSGGVFPYIYDWGGGVTTEDRYSLAAGTYTVTATDANNCTIVQSYTITQPAAITSGIVTTDVTCAGANNGAADLTVAGGTAPYTFTWSNFKVSEDLTGIAGGTYYVIITDANGCTHRDSAIINEPTPLVLSTVVTNISCSGNNSGAVDLTVTGGTLNYSFAWSNGATTEDLTGLAQGIYTVTVTDGNGCTATASATVTQPNALAVVAAVQDVTCSGDNDGAINLTVSGGSVPYSFSWNNSATTEDLVNLTAGTYDVTVTDINGCSITGSYVVNEPAAITSSIAGTNVLCQGANNGTADLTVTGGTPPYTYLWSNFQGSQDVNNLDGGIYYVLITDASGCTHRDSVIILEPSPLILSTVVVNVSCNNANDGTIDLTVQGGTSNYSYAWSSGQTTQDLSGLAGGTYVVTVTDFNGCTAVSSNTVVNPSPIAANFISHRPLCYGDANGSIDMIPTGGTPPFVFAWSNGATTEDVNGLIADTYFITITDSRGCTLVDSVVITQPDPLVTSGFIKNVSCAGFKDGFLDITGYGGTLPYTFQWNTLQSTEDIGNLSGGNYYVTVTDANLCQVASLYVVTEPDTLHLELFGTNVSCNGGNNGTAFAVYSGGTTPYQFLWEDFTTGPIRTGLSAGYYAIMLTDSNGCFALDSITLTAPNAITISGVTTNVVCNGAATGAIDITVAGGTGTFTFTWSNTATIEDLTAVAAGVYTVTVTDASGCTATASFTLTEPLPIALSTIFTNPGCHGGTNGSVSVVALQGVGPYTYSWNTTPVQTAASAQALTAGTYTVTVTDSKGCTASVSQTLSQPDSIVVTTDSHAAKCFNTASGYVIADVAGGQSPFVYELNGFAQASDTFTNLLPGNYIILVTDVNGCEGTATFNIPQASQISVDLGVTQQVIATGMNTQLVATANSTSPILNYFWTPDSLFDFSACGDPANCNNPLVHPATTTLFTVTVMNSDSCYASDTISVFVSSSLSYFISTAFTPNGDGLNDRFQFDVLGADNLEIDIFNRWGQRFYHDDNQTNGFGNTDGWDGNYNGHPAPEDTYVYKLKITYFDNTTREIEGTITLMR